MLQRQQTHGAVARPAVLLNLLFKALLQPRLSRKRAHQRQTRDGLAQQPRQLTHLLLTALSGGQHPPRKAAHQHSHQRRQQQRGHRQLPIQRDHVAEHDHQLKNAGNGLLDVLVDHLADPIGVFGQAIGEITG